MGGSITAISYLGETERSVWMSRKAHSGDSALQQERAWEQPGGLLAEGPHTQAGEVAVGGEWKQCGFPSKNRFDHRDRGNNKWIKLVSGRGKKMREEKLGLEKGEAASGEAARVSGPWTHSQWQICKTSPTPLSMSVTREMNRNEGFISEGDQT